MDKFSINILLVVAALAVVAVQADKCNKYPPLIGFQIDKYLGRWWETEVVPTVSQLPGKCWSSYYYRDIANVNKVKLRMDYVARLTNAPNTFFSTVGIPNPTHDPSLFMYAVPAMPWMKKQYRVLATDYDNFSVEYMCNINMFGNEEETVWVLTRSRHPSLEVMQQARHTLQVLGLDKIKLYEADQSCLEKPMKSKNLMEWLMSVKK